MNALEIRNLNKAYRDFALQNLNLTLPSGCIMGLVGENGAGKSTTIKLLLNMIRRDSGEIRILGQEIREDSSSAIKEEIGVVLDEVGIPECLTPRQINGILKRTYAHWEEDTFQRYLHLLSLPAEKEFKEFSRGMKMKLGIAVALSHKAKLLILDEATSGLDPVVRDEVVEIFSEFTRDPSHSVLISSHIVSDLEKLCDYIAFLHKGQLMLCEEKDRLLEIYGLLHCTERELSSIDPAAVKGRKISPYGIEAVVDKRKLPSGFSAGPLTLEELFVYMAKGEKNG